MSSATVGGARVFGGADPGWIATLILGPATTVLGVVELVQLRRTQCTPESRTADSHTA